MPTSLIAAGTALAGSAGGGALLGGLASGLGSFFGNKSASDAAAKAAQAQAAATREATALQKQIYETNTQNATPYMTAGKNALGIYGDATGTNGLDAQRTYFNNFQNDPYYQSVLKAGTDAVSNSAAARGTLYGGNTLRAINDYGGNLQMQAYQNRLGQLQNLYGSGLSATNALAGVGTNYANNTGSLLTNAANNGTNSMFTSGLYNANGMIGVGNALSNNINSYMNRQALAQGQNAYNGG